MSSVTNQFCAWALSRLESLEKKTIPLTSLPPVVEGQPAMSEEQRVLQNQQVTEFHHYVRTTTAKIAPIALAFTFVIYQTIPTLVGVSLGSAIGLFVVNSKNAELAKVVDKVKALWSDQRFKDTFSLLALSFFATLIVIGQPPAAFAYSFGLGAFVAPYALPYAQSTLQAYRNRPEPSPSPST